MGDENKTQETQTTDEVVVDAADIVGRLEQVMKNASTFRAAQVSSNEEASKGTIRLAPDGELATEVKDVEVDVTTPLRKNFETVAKVHPDFRHFATTKAMDDPVSYLRERAPDRTGKMAYKVKDGDLEEAIMICLATRNENTEGAIPARKWASTHNQESAIAQAFEVGAKSGMFGQTTQENNMVRKALDTGSGSGGPLIRTDIDPLLREAYLRRFPLYDEIRKFPANGLVHTYNQRTDVGTASLVDELGDLAATEDQSTYGRQATSHIAVMAARRQISLKLQYAIPQSGMTSFDLSGSGNLEVMGALTALASLDQALICQGNYSAAGKTKDDEEGATNVKGFDGLRYILRDSTTSITKASTDSYLRTINRAVADIVNSGGDVNNLRILCSLYARMDIEDELMNFLRIVQQTPGGGIPTNLSSNGILTVADTVTRLMPIPAGSQTTGIGYYTFSAAATEDLYVVDPGQIGIAYLGSATPSILELPIGFNNALSNVYVPFMMHGLTVFVTKFNRKIRIARVTS